MNQIFEGKTLFLAPALAQILLRQPQKGPEAILSQYRILPNQQWRLLLFPVSIVAESRKL